MAKLIYASNASLDGGSKPALPADTRVELALLDEGRFSNGVVHLRHRVL